MATTTNPRRKHTAPILCLVVLLNAATLAQQLSVKTSVDKLDKVVVRNPASVSTLISATSLKFRGSAKYQVRVEFNFKKNIPEGSLRVQLYAQPNASKTWSPLQRFSNTGSIKESTLSVSKDSQWLITSWYPDSTRRGGIADCGIASEVADASEGKTKGVRFEFKTPYGATVVTVMPVS